MHICLDIGFALESSMNQLLNVNNGDHTSYPMAVYSDIDINGSVQGCSIYSALALEISHSS